MDKPKVAYCRDFFHRGNCRYGQKCKFLHVDNPRSKKSTPSCGPAQSLAQVPLVKGGDAADAPTAQLWSTVIRNDKVSEQHHRHQAWTSLLTPRLESSKSSFLEPRSAPSDFIDKPQNNSMSSDQNALATAMSIVLKDKLRKWELALPDVNGQMALSCPLGTFLQQTLDLINDPEVEAMQSVIRSLAASRGCILFRKCTEPNVEEDSLKTKKSTFVTCLVPMFKIFTHPKVLASIELKEQVDYLYRFMYGGGARATIVLNLALEALDQAPNGLLATDPDVACTYLEVTIHLLATLTKFHSDATENAQLRRIARELVLNGLVKLLTGDFKQNFTPQIVRDLPVLNQLFEAGLKIPEIKLEGPEHDKALDDRRLQLLAKRQQSGNMPGGRHDNDFEDFCRVKVFPTFDEIVFRGKEYLPLFDPEKLHLPGVEGLLDRQFRLFRYDNVLPVKESIKHVVTQHQQLGGSGNMLPRRCEGSQVYMHRQAAVEKFVFERTDGFILSLTISQPSQILSHGASARQQWWAQSQRLTFGTFVCILDPKGNLLFGEVYSPKERGRPADAFDPKVAANPLTPQAALPTWFRQRFRHAKFAHIDIKLIDPDPQTLECLLQMSPPDNSGELLLLEFPSIVLPSFYPTLKRLQEMKLKQEHPFSDILAPYMLPSSNEESSSAPLMTMNPPKYATAPDFYFNLAPLMIGSGEDVRLTMGQAFDVSVLQQGASVLDDTQASSLVQALSRDMALIQGPPGTGKSYTGVRIIETLLASERLRQGQDNLSPILCVCYTNHALDQLLEHLISANVPGVVRIGSRSKSELLQDRNLRQLVKQGARSKGQKDKSSKSNKDLGRTELELRSLIEKLTNDTSMGHIKDHLFNLHNDTARNLLGHTVDEDGDVDEEDANRVLTDWLKGGGPPPAVKRRSAPTTELYKLSASDRNAKFDEWNRELRAIWKNDLIERYADHVKFKTERDEILDDVDFDVLRHARVIGATTSGLGSALKLLKLVKPKILLVEEAGEITEAHTLTALLPTIEHAILIGDHQQLKPQINCYELQSENPRGKKHSLDISLFERLVSPASSNLSRLPCSTLNTQRRMHPSISNLIRQTLYPALEDGEKVALYPDVRGLDRRLFWLDHNQNEDILSGHGAMSTSHSNTFEIEMIAALVKYLIRQGVYRPSDIAVLTPYQGQLSKLQRRLASTFEVVLVQRHEHNDSDSEGSDQQAATTIVSLQDALRLATIDNFQGEEAKIVLISLVRCNPENNCGFLRTSNRINVLLSRAMHGMVIIGSSKTSSSVPMWEQVQSILKKSGNIGEYIDISCSRHADMKMRASKSQDFEAFYGDGGCPQPCGLEMSCGHICEHRCHSEALHRALPCDTIIKSLVKLPCGHEVSNVPCSSMKDLSKVACACEVERKYPSGLQSSL